MALAPQILDVDLKTQEARFMEANPRHGNASQAATARRQVLLTLAEGRGPARGRMASTPIGLGEKAIG